jgi:hypothetical protein
VESAGAWLIVSTSWAVKGGWSPAARFSHATLPCHGRFAQLFAQMAKLTITAIARLLFQRFLARVEERLAPGSETGGGYPQFA